MSNITGSINLASFKDCAILTCKAPIGTNIPAGTEVLIIPVVKNDLYKSEKGGVYFQWIAFPSDKIKDYSHAIKQSFSKENREKMTEEEKKTQPFFGNIKSGSQSIPEAAPAVVNADDVF